MDVASSRGLYEAKTYELHGLEGISDRTLETHFALYEGYVKETNNLTTRIRNLLADGHIDLEEQPGYSELKRRCGFEYNGMVLHEYYFDNLMRHGSPEPGAPSPFRKSAEDSFGTYETWKVDFVGVGKMRGVGWVICYLNPYTGRLTNHWITLHESGHIAGFIPILVMDVWEHAFILDFKPSERASYIESFFANINWNTVEYRMQRSAGPTSIPALA